MASKNKAFLAGVSTGLIVAIALYFLIDSLILSVFAGLIAGVVVGLLVDRF